MNYRGFILYLIHFFFIGLISLPAQEVTCPCHDCPGDILDGEEGVQNIKRREYIRDFHLNIFNVLRNDLSNPNQCIKSVFVDFKHDFIGDLKMFLISPAGQEIQLIGPISSGLLSGISSTDRTIFKVGFVPSSGIAQPEDDLEKQWSNEQDWAVFGTRRGLYYPYFGNLEDFNQGSVNGSWTLRVIDGNPEKNDIGVLRDFSVEFCDPTGLVCDPCKEEKEAGIPCVFELTGSQEQITPIESTCIDVLAQNVAFVKNMQWQMTWDDKVVAYESIKNILPPTGISINDFSIDDNSIELDFTIPTTDTLGLVVADSSVLFQVCFNGEGEEGDSTLFTFDKIDVTVIGDSIPLTASEAGKINLTVDASADCIAAKQLCGKLPIEITQTKGPGFEKNEGDPAGCWREDQEIQSKWFKFDILETGTLEYLIQPKSTAGHRYTLFKDGCGGVVVDCSAGAASSDRPIGASSDGLATFGVDGKFSASIAVNEGEKYFLVIDNKDENGVGFDLKFGGTATIGDASLNAIIETPPILNCSRPNITLNTAGTSEGEKYDYRWTITDGNFIDSLDALSPILDKSGLYALEVSDTKTRCSTTASVTVTDDFDFPMADAGQGFTLNCTQPDYVLNGSASSQGAIFSHDWSNIVGTVFGKQDITNALIDRPGLYIIKVTNTTNNCVSRDTVEVLDSFDKPDLNTEHGVINCRQSMVSSIAVSSTSGVRIAWTSEALASPVTDKILTTGIPGIYTVTATAPNGCTSTSEVNIADERVFPTANAGADFLLTCATPNYLLKGDSSSQADQIIYEWRSPNGQFLADTDLTTLNPRVDQAGNYMLKVTDERNGCVQEDTVVISQDFVLPTVRLEADSVLTCFQESITIDATSSDSSNLYDFEWQAKNGGNIATGETTYQPSVDRGGTFILTITNNQTGCSNQDSVRLSESQDRPNVITQDDSISCLRRAVVLAASSDTAGVVLEWTGEFLSMPVPGGSITVDVPSVYEVRATAPNGCVTSKSVVVADDRLPPNLAVSADSTLTCSIDGIDLLANSSTPATAFKWSIPNGDTLLTAAITAIEPGLYINTATAINGCTSTDTVLIKNDENAPIAVIDSAVAITCDAPIVNLNAFGSSEGPTFSYEWVTEDGDFEPLTSLDTLTTSVITEGSYQLIIFDSSNGCESTASVQVTDIRMIPSITFDRPIVDTLNCIDNSLSYIATTSAIQPSYKWQLNGEIISESEELLATKAGIYRLVVTDLANNCPRLETITIESDMVAPISNAGLSQELTCTKGTVELDGTASSTGAEFSYVWTTEAGETFGSDRQTSVSQPGLYRLVVVNTRSGCRTLDTVRVTASLDYPIANAGLDTVYCKDIEDLELTIGTNATSQGADFIYEWTDSTGTILGTAIEQTVFTGGDFSLKVTNTSNNCNAFDTMQITERPRPIISLERTGAINCKDNLVSFIARSSLPNTTIVWNGEEVFEDSILTATDVLLNKEYVALGTENTTGCKGFSDFIKIEADRNPPLVNAGGTAALNCKDTLSLNGSFSVKGPQYMYTWSTENGNIIKDPDSLFAQVDAPGTYKLTIFNQNNFCTNSDTVLVSDNRLLPTVNLGEDKLITCLEDRFDLTSDSTENRPTLFYEWTDETNTILATTRILEDVSTSGLYQLRVVDSFNLCENFDRIEIIQKDTLPTLSLADSTIIDCVTPTTQLIATSSISESIIWTSVDGNIESGPTTLSPTVNAGGLYFVTVENTENGCTATDSILVIDKQEKPTIEAGENTTLTCYNDSLVTLIGVLLSTPSNITLEWTASDTAFQTIKNDLTVVVDQAATYYLTATNDLTGCFSRDSIIVSQSIASVDFSLPTDSLVISCLIPEIPIGVPALATDSTLNFDWTTDNGKIIGATDAAVTFVNQAGDYQLVVLNKVNGCTNRANIVVAASDDLPTVDIGPDQMLTCANPEAILGTANTIEGKEYDYQWTNSNGMPLPAMDSIYITVDQAGTYQLLVTNETNGCQQASTVQVSAQLTVEGIELPANNTLTCKDSIINLTIQQTIQNQQLVYTWTSLDDGIISPTDLPSVSVNKGGMYFISILDETTSCVLSDTIMVNSDQLAPTASAGNDQIRPCNDTNITLSSVGSSMGESFVYEWTNEQGATLSRESTVPIARTGQYTLSVKNTLNGCTATDIVEFLENTNPPTTTALTILPPSCQGSSNAQINVDSVIGGQAPFDIQVNGNDFGAPIFANLSDGDYLLTIKDDLQCEWDTMIVIEAPAALELEIEASTNQLIAGDFLQLAIGGDFNANTVETVRWTPTDIFDCSDCPTLDFRLFQTTDIGLSVIDQNGCEGETTLLIDVMLAEMPNAITPNGDGNNDVFRVPAIEIGPTAHPDNEMVIFNRWGDVVFRAAPYANDWAGTHNGQDLPEGTYYYVLRLDISEGAALQGEITILR